MNKRKMNQLLLGLDIGSSSVKAALVDVVTGRCVSTDFYPHQEAPIKAVRSGWAEQRPDDWWHYVKEAVASAMKKASAKAEQVVAIGISYQMHGLVALDKSMIPVRDAIIWCDSRGTPYGRRAFDELGAGKCMKHLLNSPGNFTAAKLCWVKENEPETYERINKVMLPGDYVAWRLTGELCTNAEGLSEYMLWDFAGNAPAKFLMDYYGFDMSLLPPLSTTFGQQGRLTGKAAAEIGLAEGTPVTYRAGDQPNNALSLGVLNPGEVASTAGTSGVVYGIIGQPKYDPQSRVNCFAHVNHTAESPRIGVMTCINGTGILNSWCRRNVTEASTSYDEMNRLAAQAPVGSAGLVALPFGNGAERVLENRQIGASFKGLNFNIHSRHHLLRAAQEGIVFSFMYGMEIMESMGMDIRRIHAGHTNMFLSPVFRQTLASVSGATIELYDTDGAVGAARGAGIGAGIYKDANEAFATLSLVGRVEPDADATPYREAYERWKKCLANEIE